MGSNKKSKNKSKKNAGGVRAKVDLAKYVSIILAIFQWQSSYCRIL